MKQEKLIIGAIRLIHKNMNPQEKENKFKEDLYYTGISTIRIKLLMLSGFELQP